MLDFSIVDKSKLINISVLVIQLLILFCIVKILSSLIFIFFTLVIFTTLGGDSISDLSHKFVNIIEKTSITDYYRYYLDYDSIYGNERGHSLVFIYLFEKLSEKIGYFRIYLYIILLFIIFAIIRNYIIDKSVFLSKSNKNRINKEQILIQELRRLLNFDNIMIGNKTCLIKSTLFVSLKDIKLWIQYKRTRDMSSSLQSLLFILYHEILHFKALDSTIGYLCKIITSFNVLCISFIISIIFCIYVSDVIPNFTGSGTILVITLFWTFYWLFKKLFNSFYAFSKYKEHLADLFSYCKIKPQYNINIEEAFDTLINTLNENSSKLHPLKTERIVFLQKNSTNYLPETIFCYLNIQWVIVYSLPSIIDVHFIPYHLGLVLFILSSLIFFFIAIYTKNISNGKRFYLHLFLLIISIIVVFIYPATILILKESLLLKETISWYNYIHWDSAIHLCYVIIFFVLIHLKFSNLKRTENEK